MVMLSFAISGFVFAAALSVGADASGQDSQEAPSLRQVLALDETADRHLVVGGSDAPLGLFPYFALLDVGVEGGHFYCGASLIYPDILLTAAQCSIGAESYTVSINATSFTTDQVTYEISRDVMGTPLVHPGYSPSGDEKDVMLVKLSEPVYSVNPVKLNDSPEVPFQNAPITVIGLGSTEEAVANSDPDTLQEVTVPVMRTSDCNSGDSYYGTIIETDMFCAGETNGGKVSASSTAVCCIVCRIRSSCLSSELTSCYTRMLVQVMREAPPWR